MKKNYTFILAIIFAVVSQPLFAQYVTNQVIVCSGGNFSDPDDYVTVSSYSPVTEITTVFGTIFTQSVQSVIVNNGFAFVAAQDSIVKYNIDSYERVAAIGANGVHKLAVYDQVLVASFWYPETGDFVKTYSIENLSPLNVFSEVTGESDGIMIKPNGTAIVAVPGGWGSTSGKIAWINLNNNEFLAEVDLGEPGIGISFFVSYIAGVPGNASFTKTQWGDSTFNVYGFDEIGNVTYTYKIDAVLEDYTGIGGATMYGEFNGGIGQFDLSTSEFDENLVVEPTSLPISGSVYDSINELFYVSSTDYATAGNGEIYNMDGDIVGNFDAGVAAEALAMDYRNIDLVSERKVVLNLAAIPNPAHSNFTISADEEINSVNITDLTGRQFLHLTNRQTNWLTINIAQLPIGLYIVSCQTEKGVASTKLLKN